MASRIVIQHLSGTKANQIEQFPVEGLVEFSMGRDPSCNMAFDSQHDDAVSRKHAVIRIKMAITSSWSILEAERYARE